MAPLSKMITVQIQVPGNINSLKDLKLAIPNKFMCTTATECTARFQEQKTQIPIQGIDFEEYMMLKERVELLEQQFSEQKKEFSLQKKEFSQRIKMLETQSRYYRSPFGRDFCTIIFEKVAVVSHNKLTLHKKTRRFRSLKERNFAQHWMGEKLQINSNVHSIDLIIVRDFLKDELSMFNKWILVHNNSRASKGIYGTIHDGFFAMTDFQAGYIIEAGGLLLDILEARLRIFCCIDNTNLMQRPLGSILDSDSIHSSQKSIENLIRDFVQSVDNEVNKESTTENLGENFGGNVERLQNLMRQQEWEEKGQDIKALLCRFAHHHDLRCPNNLCTQCGILETEES